MYEKIETNDEGDISMRNVITHIQSWQKSGHQTNCNYKHSACGIFSIFESANHDLLSIFELSNRDLKKLEVIGGFCLTSCFMTLSLSFATLSVQQRNRDIIT